MESCSTCKAPICISQLNLFSNLTQTQRNEIIKNVTRRGFRKGDIFISQGDINSRFVVVNRGQFKAMCTNEDGKAKVYQYLKAGDFFGQDCLFKEKKIQYSIEAMTEGALCMIDGKTIKELISDPDFALSILSELNNRVIQLEIELSDSHAECLEVRLMNLLIHLSHDYGVKVERGIKLNCPLSQDELAMRLGVSRESVNRKLKQLEKDGRIKLQSRREIIIY